MAPLTEVFEVVTLVGAENGGQGWEGKGELLFNGYEVSVLQDEVSPRDLLYNTVQLTTLLCS